MRVRRIMTITLEGDDSIIDRISESVMTNASMILNDAGKGQVRFRMSGQSEYLDRDWQVIATPEDEMRSLRRDAEAAISALEKDGALRPAAAREALGRVEAQKQLPTPKRKSKFGPKKESKDA